MCQCTVYAVLIVRLLHYHHIGTCTYFISQQIRNPVSATIGLEEIVGPTTVLIQIRVTLGHIAGAADG